MGSDEPVVWLRHGTTRRRAEAILQDGPDLNYREPGGFDRAEGFSTARLHGPYPYGSPDEVAAKKAQLFPDEGGPAFLEIAAPESIVRKADLIGEVRFIPGYGFEELLAIWPTITKRILLP